jgi:hypothetical protein
MDTKQLIKEYKHTLEEALHGLKNVRAEEAAFPSPTTEPASSSSNKDDYDSFDLESNQLVT